MYGPKPNVSFVKVFGCKAFSYIEKQLRGKLDHRAQEGVFLGFSNNSKTFIIGNPVEQGNYKITKTRNAKFHKDVMFCKAKNHRNQHSSLEGPPVANINFGDVNETEFCNEPVAILNEETVENQLSPLRRSARLNQNTNYEFSAEVEEILKCNAELPQNTTEALKNENWRDAMQQEYNSLIKNQVWELVPLPENVKAFGSKWNFANKYDSDGNVTKHKARFVAKGYSQQQGIDYKDTYSPTTRLSTLRIILQIVANLGGIHRQMDIKTAYLIAPIEENVYGLKQLGRNWFLTLKGQLETIGFEACIHDPCLFIKNGITLWQ